VRERLDAALEQYGVAAKFAMLACEERAYCLFIESEASPLALAAVARALDGALRENIQYDYCRRLGQLGDLTLFRITREGSATYLEHANQRLGDVKLVSVDARQGWSGRFSGSFVGSGLHLTGNRNRRPDPSRRNDA
jgi:hypothetical protein